MHASKAVPADQIDYVDLYTRWEHNNWSAMDIDFSQDKLDWDNKFDDFMRKAARWNYSLFFFGEDAVADNLSPYIDACPLEEQKYFVTTQQVDEARHAIFFDRFFREVIGVDANSVGESLRSTFPDLTWGLRKVFEMLDTVAGELRTDKSLPKLAQAITLYHLIVEATLAQTGQHFITEYLTEMDMLPGFQAGMVNVEKDEQRHIAFGVKMLRDLDQMDAEVRPAIREMLSNVLPYSLSVFRPPNDDERYVTVFGKTQLEIFETGERQLESRLSAAGLPLHGPNGVIPFRDPTMPYEDRAKRAQKLLQSGMMSQGTEPLKVDDEAMTYFFDIMKLAIRPDHGLKKPQTIQWDFKDVEPWHLTINNGSSEAHAGRAASPDLTFKVSLVDWLAITSGQLNLVKAFATGRLRPSGSMRTLAQMPRIFER
ncbi:MAG: ribonucleotide-diphosphate reductase subunit beta [Thermoleophilaceae bacterium]|nr:ribonucleotide-diphosphate reductase subunit beta [Thermoleophilaceae bacterium]